VRENHFSDLGLVFSTPIGLGNLNLWQSPHRALADFEREQRLLHPLEWSPGPLDTEQGLRPFNPERCPRSFDSAQCQKQSNREQSPRQSNRKQGPGTSSHKYSPPPRDQVSLSFQESTNPRY